VTSLLTRASQLAQQAQTGTISASNRANLDAEYQNIIGTLGNIAQNTKFNGSSVFTATTVNVQAGDYGQIGITLSTLGSTGTTNALGLTQNTSKLDTATNAGTAATAIATALESVSTLRASIGANQAQLNATSSVLGIQVQNFTAAASQIMDANIADEVVSLTKFQILNQSGTSALAKSNQSAQQILALLQ